MRYLLDTNVWSELARPQPLGSVRRAFHRYDPQFAMAAPVADELTFGVARLPDSKRKVLLAEWLAETLDAYPILPSDLPAARWHGQERARRMAIGRPAPMVDGQIAAIAVVNHLILCTAFASNARISRACSSRNGSAAWGWSDKSNHRPPSLHDPSIQLVSPQSVPTAVRCAQRAW